MTPGVLEQAWLDGLALLACAVAVYTDARWRRIPNWLTLGTAASGLLLQCVRALQTEDARTLLSPLLGGALVFFLFLLMSARGLVGFGDTKLLGAVGVCLGFMPALRALTCTLIAGGLVAVIYGLFTGQLGRALRNVRANELGAKPIDEPGHGLHAMPYALAIALGTSWSILARYQPALSPF